MVSRTPICKHCYTDAYMVQLNMQIDPTSHVEVRAMNKNILLFCCGRCGTVQIDGESQKFLEHRLRPYGLTDDE